MSIKSTHWGQSGYKKYTVLIHVMVWVILIVFPNLLNIYRLDSSYEMSNIQQKFMKLDLLMYIYWISAYYFNSRVLVPRLLLNGKYVAFAAIVSGMLLTAVLLDIGLRALLGVYSFPIAIICYFRFPVMLLIVAAGIAFTVIETQQKYREKLNETDRESLKTELSFLRSQMSPHFIFNVLNNIVSLVRLKSQELEPTVMKLSGLMQYTLYHTEEQKVSLKTETEYLTNYIDLQKQRFSQKVKIDAIFDLYDENVMIEPLLLIPFVENAFKHGTGLIDGPKISVLLKTDSESLNFKVMNKFDPSGTIEKDMSSGIGIANVRRRIELLYGEYHQLNIASRNDVFEVELVIKLKHD